VLLAYYSYEAHGKSNEQLKQDLLGSGRTSLKIAFMTSQSF